MGILRIHTLYFLAALVLAGLAAYVGVTGKPVLGQAFAAARTPSAVNAGATPFVTPAVATSGATPAVTTPAVGDASATPAVSGTAPSAATVTAIKAVIDKGNQEQQAAFAANDPTLMKDTATSDYYNQLVQTNQQLRDSGVTAIKLLTTEWGPITQTGATTAQATTYETWETTYNDGSTDQSRDRNVYTLTLVSGAWKIQADDHPDSGGSPLPGTAVPGTPSAGPAPTPVPPALPTASTGLSSSQNWAGYAATQGNYTGVTGTWIVPQPQANGQGTGEATWVGIGGVSQSDLIQAGTEDIAGASGNVSYDAWVETLPQASRPVQLAVKPGDKITVSITDTGNDQWAVKLKNDTTGGTFQTTVQYPSSHSSAECVEEAPSGRRQVQPLDNFGTVQFSDCTVTRDGTTETIGQAGGDPIQMINRAGTILAQPSSLSSGGAAFNVSRVNLNSPLPISPFSGIGGRLRRPFGFGR